MAFEWGGPCASAAAAVATPPSCREAPRVCRRVPLCTSCVQAVTDGLAVLGDLSDLYSTSPQSDLLLAAGFQNRVALGGLAQLNSNLFSVRGVGGDGDARMASMTGRAERGA